MDSYGKDQTQIFGAMVFVIEKDPAEREALRAQISEMGCLVVSIATLDAAVALLQNGALCEVIVVSTDAMDDSPARYDLLLSAADKPPPIIVYGVDPKAKLVLHCLNRGARDFLPKPFDSGELMRAVESAVARERSSVARPPLNLNAIVASNPLTNWIELTSSSELEQFRRLQRFSDTLFASNLPPAVCADLRMAVEEVGRNAVEWGNGFDPDKQVHVSYCIFDDRVVIKVEDEGEGFAPELIPNPTTDPLRNMRERMEAGKRPGGYGVFLIQQLMDEIVYNEKGNAVLMTKYLPPKEGRKE